MFVSTWGRNRGREAKCGIGSYSFFLWKEMSDPFYVLSQSPEARFEDKVIGVMDRQNSNRELLRDIEFSFNGTNGTLPVFWYQHTFGNFNTELLLEDIASMDSEVIVTPHTLYFQRTLGTEEGTSSGMRQEEYSFLERLLELDNVKALAVLSDGTYNVAIGAFPEYKSKITEIRHGVHSFLGLSRSKARKQFLGYLKDALPDTSKRQKITKALNDGNKLLVSSGFINEGREEVFEVGEQIELLLDMDIYRIHIGDLHPDAVKYGSEGSYNALKAMQEYDRMSERNIFIQMHTPNKIFPATLAMADLFYAYNPNITQSGRTCYLLGMQNVLILAGDFEGEGETLRLIGFPLARSKAELPEIGARLFTIDYQQRAMIEWNKRKYLRAFNWKSQVKKHGQLMLYDPSRQNIPELDINSVQRYSEVMRSLTVKPRYLPVQSFIPAAQYSRSA